MLINLERAGGTGSFILRHGDNLIAVKWELETEKWSGEQRLYSKPTYVFTVHIQIGCLRNLVF